VFAAEVSQCLFAQWQGKRTGYTKGRDRSFHFGTNEHPPSRAHDFRTSVRSWP
jgi:TPP-dependent pyruvate/acetoin dehydrogenase alpha subunit